MRISRLLYGVLLVMTLAGCSDKDRVLATVGGKEVKQSEFDAYLKLKRIPAEDEKRREAALDEFLKRRSLAASIEKESKLDADLLRAEVEEFRKEMLISRYFEQFLDESVSDEAVQGSYGNEAAKYEERKVHVAHILVRVDKRMSEEQRQAKFTTAQEIHSKLTAGGNFEELAKQYSEDKISGSRGGDLGWIKEGTIDARFSQRAFESKVGVISEPFETPFGFHIIQVIEEPKTIRRPLGAVAGEIRYRLRNESKTRELERLEGLAAIVKKKPYELKAGGADGEALAAVPGAADPGAPGAKPPAPVVPVAP